MRFLSFKGGNGLAKERLSDLSVGFSRKIR